MTCFWTWTWSTCRQFRSNSRKARTQCWPRWELSWSQYPRKHERNNAVWVCNQDLHLYFQQHPVTVQFLRADLAQRLAGELEAVDKVDGTMLRCWTSWSTIESDAHWPLGNCLFSLFFVQDFNQMQRTLCKACRTFWIWKMNLWSQELPIPCYTSGAADGWVVYLEWIRGGFVGAYRSNCAQRPRKWWDRLTFDVSCFWLRVSSGLLDGPFRLWNKR